MSELRLRDFRCFESLCWAPHAHLNFLVGSNAQGKTTILEAVCCLLRLQSPRTRKLQELCRHNQSGFALTGWLNERKLHLRYDQTGRTLALDDIPQSSSKSWLTLACVAWFANDHIKLVQGASGERRRFLDFMASQISPSYLQNLRSYERALRSRNFLLREGRLREKSAYDGPLITHGSAVQETRKLLCEELRPLVRQACTEIAGLEEAFDMTYLSGNKDDLAEALANSAKEEERLRQTLVGPHRDDLSLTLDSLPAASYASEGQQKTLVLGLKLAQSRLLQWKTKEPLLCLLDDIFGELDPLRRNHLLQALPKESQILITTTHLGWLAESPQGAIWKVDKNTGIDLLS